MKRFDPIVFKQARKSKGYTQKALGDALGTTERNVQFWESGKFSPTVDYLLCAMDLLDLSPTDLLKDDEE